METLHGGIAYLAHLETPTSLLHSADFQTVMNGTWVGCFFSGTVISPVRRVSHSHFMSWASVFLLVIGLLQMTGDLLRVPQVKGLAAATGASPAPRVFSSVNGLETFSSDFYIEWKDRNGAANAIKLTPDLYSRIRGPYNRRNVFGAALSYAPVLARDPRTKPMYDAVVHYALCGQAPLLREIGIDPTDVSEPPIIRLVPRADTRFGQAPFLITPSCQ
jgi:hypothetical protein